MLQLLFAGNSLGRSANQRRFRGLAAGEPRTVWRHRWIGATDQITGWWQPLSSGVGTMSKKARQVQVEPEAIQLVLPIYW